MPPVDGTAGADAQQAAQEKALALYSRRAFAKAGNAAVTQLATNSVHALAELMDSSVRTLIALEHVLQQQVRESSSHEVIDGLSAGGTVCGLGSALLQELAAMEHTFRFSAREVGKVGEETCASMGAELATETEALREGVSTFVRGLEVDVAYVRSRLVEGIQFLLPICELVTPSFRATSAARPIGIE